MLTKYKLGDFVTLKNKVTFIGIICKINIEYSHEYKCIVRYHVQQLRKETNLRVSADSLELVNLSTIQEVL